SDLHNIYPADTRVELERRNAKFEELPASIAADDCGLKRSFQIIDPPDTYKGDIARIILYMAESYELAVIGYSNQPKRSNSIDPPSPEEIDRNRHIQQIQGNESRFITIPQAVEGFGQ